MFEEDEKRNFFKSNWKQYRIVEAKHFILRKKKVLSFIHSHIVIEKQCVLYTNLKNIFYH